MILLRAIDIFLSLFFDIFLFLFSDKVTKVTICPKKREENEKIRLFFI